MKEGKGIYFNAIISANNANNYLISNCLNSRAASNYISALGFLVVALRMSVTTALGPCPSGLLKCGRRSWSRWTPLLYNYGVLCLALIYCSNKHAGYHNGISFIRQVTGFNFYRGSAQLGLEFSCLFFILVFQPS
jgi:hypothetical protein